MRPHAVGSPCHLELKHSKLDANLQDLPPVTRPLREPRVRPCLLHKASSGSAHPGPVASTTPSRSKRLKSFLQTDFTFVMMDFPIERAFPPS